MEVLQTSALPLGYVAGFRRMTGIIPVPSIKKLRLREASPRKCRVRNINTVSGASETGRRLINGLGRVDLTRRKSRKKGPFGAIDLVFRSGRRDSHPRPSPWQVHACQRCACHPRPGERSNLRGIFAEAVRHLRAQEKMRAGHPLTAAARGSPRPAQPVQHWRWSFNMKQTYPRIRLTQWRH